MTGGRPNIGVLGPHHCTPEEFQLGVETGAAIARAGAALICGGLNGMMTAAAQGAKSENGLTLGLLPGDRHDDANPHIDVALPTGMGPFRNMLIARACHAVIAIRGGYGTLTEIAFALRLGVPVIGLRTWQLVQDGEEDEGIRVAETPEEAVRLALSTLERG
ncbi:MAG: TIGR00725 family protein [Verrucomicrobiota bacterium]